MSASASSAYRLRVVKPLPYCTPRLPSNSYDDVAPSARRLTLSARRVIREA